MSDGILSRVLAVFESDELEDESRGSHVCLCHQRWFDSQDELDEHLKELEQ